MLDAAPKRKNTHFKTKSQCDRKNAEYTVLKKTGAACMLRTLMQGCQYILKKILTNKGLAAAGYFEFRNYCESPYL